MADKKTDFGPLLGEYTILAYLRDESTAELMRETLMRANVNSDYFTADNLRAAFFAIMQMENLPDRPAVEKILKTHIPQLTDKSTWKPGTTFDLDMELLAEGPHLVADAVNSFAMAHIKRTMHAELQSLQNEAPHLDVETYAFKAKSITDGAELSIKALHAAIPLCPADLIGDNDDGDSVPTTDESLLHMPGLVEDIVEFCMSIAPRPNRVLAFAGAITMLAHIVGRRYYARGGTFSNLFVVALAGSGAGKNATLTINSKIARCLNIQPTMAGDIATGQGLEDALVDTPVLLSQIDEFSHKLEFINDTRNKQQGQMLEKTFLDVFTKPHMDYTTRARASSNGKKVGREVICNPCFSIFATSVPKLFYSALTEANLVGGFLARFLVFEAGRKQPLNPTANMMANIPDEIASKLKQLERRRSPQSDRPEDEYDMVEVQYSDDAKDAASNVASEAERLADAAEGKDEMAVSVWNRSAEMARKLALLYAISENAGRVSKPVISKEAVEWSWRLVKALQMRMLAMAHKHSANSEILRLVNKAKEVLDSEYPNGMLRSDLMTALKANASLMNEVSNTLVQMGIARRVTLGRGANGVAAEKYFLIKKKKKGAR